jgi:hypothetical protein
MLQNRTAAGLPSMPTEAAGHTILIRPAGYLYQSQVTCGWCQQALIASSRNPSRAAAAASAAELLTRHQFACRSTADDRGVFGRISAKMAAARALRAAATRTPDAAPVEVQPGVSAIPLPHFLSLDPAPLPIHSSAHW